MIIFNKTTKEWCKAAAVRAVKTMAQTGIAMLPVAAAITEVDWVAVASTAAFGAHIGCRAARIEKGRVIYICQ